VEEGKLLVEWIKH